MNCPPLAATGPTGGLEPMLGIALVLVLAGIIVLLTVGRSRRARGVKVTATLTLALIVGAAVAVIPVAPAQAATANCASSGNALVVIQTSVMDGLAPGIAPRPIAGLVTNHGSDSTYITEVRVEITSVTTSANAPAGTCSVSDYTLRDSLMPVGRTVDAEASAPFSGASIGFANSSMNQDACKQAVVHLLYTANPAGVTAP